jgi:hypothetical protein
MGPSPAVIRARAVVSRQPSGWARNKVGRDGMLWLQVDGDRRRWYRYEIDA